MGAGGSSKGGKGKKIGRNSAKCQLYKRRQLREKNSVRKCSTLLHHLEKLGINLKGQELLKKKINKMQRIFDGLPA